MDKHSVRWIAASLGPLLAVAIFLIFSRLLNKWFPSFDAPYFMISIGLALAFGVSVIATHNISVTQKAAALIFYVPIAIFTLFTFALVFLCMAFGDCL